MPRPLRPLKDRFWPKVDRRGPDECWPWMGVPGRFGYCQIRLGGAGTKQELAHRVSWELHNGPIPTGFFVCHRCDNRRCCNPAHLFLGTHADNMADMVKKGRQAKGEQQRASKLTAANVRAIRKLPLPGIEIAARFNVTPQRISQIRHGKAWRHVDA